MVDKSRLYWIFQIGGWLIYAGIQIGSIFLVSASVNPRRVYFFVFEALLCLLMTHLFRFFLMRWNWLNYSILKLIPRILFAVMMMGISVFFLRLPVRLFLGLLNADLVIVPYEMIGLISVYSFLFFMWTVLYFMYHYFERYNKSLKYEASMVEIELNNLRSQLNPHFIFNALNSIRALVDENPSKSVLAINQLSNILRSSLSADKKGITRFEDEMNIVRDYLGLEAIRFEERLKIHFNIHPQSYHYLVPPLMIQTLVENGIKHGISKLKEGGEIQIITSIIDGNLKIVIKNNGQMKPGERRKSKGLGIKNTIHRLKLIYGDGASFHIANESNTFVRTEIIIPQTNFYESLISG